TLQVAVHDEGEVVETLARRDVQRAERLGLVAFAVAKESPDARPRRVLDAAMLEIAVEARLVDRGEWPETHRDGGELPEVGHEPRVRIAREAGAGHDLAAEVVELRLGEPALEKCARVDAGSGVTLEEDLVAGRSVVLAPEEVVEADLVQARRRRVRRKVPADALVVMVRANDHRDGVPTDHAPDAELHPLVAGEVRLLLRRDRVDVARLRERRQ